MYSKCEYLLRLGRYDMKGETNHSKGGNFKFKLLNYVKIYAKHFPVQCQC